MDLAKLVLLGVVAAVLCLALIVYAYNTHSGTSPRETVSPREEFRRIVATVRERKAEGYAVTDAEYYLLSAMYYYKTGDREKAVAMLKKAREAVEKAELLPEIPDKGWHPVESNVHVSRPPTAWDFVPIGAVFVQTKKGYIAYPRGDRKWKLSCFIIVAVGATEDGKLFAYQGRLPMVPEESPFKPRFYVDGKWVVPNIVFVGPIYYDEGERFGLPTAYQYDLSGKYIQYLSYDEKHRVWIHAIKRVDGETLLEIRMKGEGAPMWLGPWDGGLLVHGVYPRVKDFDLWGGFWDTGPMNATVRLEGKVLRVRGFMVFDRASHRVLYGEKRRVMGSPVSFTCMVIWQENLTIMVAHSENPSPLDPGVRFQHQLRVNIHSLNLSLYTTDFELWDNGGLQPSEFRITAKLPGGYLNITGKVYMYWPPKWVVGKGTWWNASTYFSWGRAFTKWTGVVVVGDTVIPVDAWGAGEYTRCGSARPSACAISDPTCSCWGRWGSTNSYNMTGG